jgi:ATP-dependent Clp protease protease subunit
MFRLDAAADEGVELTDAESEEVVEPATTAIMRIYEDIGEDFFTGNGMTAKKFAESLDGLGSIKRLNIHINSLGGDTHTAQAIHSIVTEYDAKKTSYIDGVAASAATIVACAADEVIARFNTNYMVHNPWSIVMGNADSLRKAADDLEKITIPIVAVYKQQVKGKITEAKIQELMDQETWLTAEEARDMGFVDQVRGKIKAISKIDNKRIFCSGRIIDFSKYQYRNVPNYPLVPRDRDKAKEKQSMTEHTHAVGPEPPHLTADILVKDYPQLVAQLKTAERDRLAALDAMRGPGLEAIIDAAKADGRLPDDIAMECFTITKTKLAENSTLTALRRDAQSTSEVPAADSSNVRPPTAQDKGISLMTGAINSNRNQARRKSAAATGRN